MSMCVQIKDLREISNESRAFRLYGRKFKFNTRTLSGRRWSCETTLQIVYSCAHTMAGIFLGANLAEERELICPKCQSHNCQRSRRRSAKDFIYGVTKIRPWRCGNCNARFFAWTVPIRYLRYVHCRRCGRFELQRISSEHGEGSLKFLWRWLHVPVYRCPPCRNRFFSMLPRIIFHSRHSEAIAEDHSTRA
jgi:DNA-directed RNA polymerase subunit RPC12/RpoP